VTTPLIWTIAITCVFVAGIVRGLTGFGFAAISIIGLGLCWPLPQAVPLVLCLEIAASVMLVPAARAQADWPLLRVLWMAAAIGVPIGVLALTRVDVDTMSLLVSLLIGGLALMGLARIKPRVGQGRLAPWMVGGVTGALIAAFSIGGPLVVAWLSHAGLRAGRLRATLILFFCAVDTVALLALAAAHAVPVEIWPLALALLLPTFAGLWVGQRLFHRVPAPKAERFTQWLLLALALVGLWNLWRH
jgi:uncharacterized membrane protein YfcA